MNVDTTNMTAGQRIMAEIISSIIEGSDLKTPWKDDINLENLDEAWESLDGDDMLNDAISEFREGTAETSIACGTCGEECELDAGEKCPNSKRECGHHCNCSWTQDECCWCGKKFEADEAEEESKE